VPRRSTSEAAALAVRVRLAAGLVLLFYVTTHLLNHALGLISLAAMEAGRDWFLAAWRNPVGETFLFGSLVLHFGLAHWALYRRRDLRMPVGEIARVLLGLAIVPLLALHVVGTRGANMVSGSHDSYTLVLLTHWKYAPINLILQPAALIAAWAHGAIGIHYWLRFKSWYRSATWLLYAAAIVVPLCALLGYAVAGREVLALARDPAWLRRTLGAASLPSAAQSAMLYQVLYGVLVLSAVALAAVGVARFARSVWERRHGIVRVSYPNGRIATFPRGRSILEVSRAAGIPHASVCGGRGRCSTCRVRVVRGLDRLPAPSADERRVLDRVGAPRNVRLACQTRPSEDLEVIPLLPPHNASVRDARARAPHLEGEEREIAILFADLRDFTRFSEQKLPYDVVFVLNRYFANMGQAVEQAGGHLDKFIGDGVMALFGIDRPLSVACREALEAARNMGRNLADLNRTLAHDLEEPLRMGIGIHAGPAIIGEMGYGAATTITAIGDSVNTASRLETMTKEYRAQLVVSEEVATHAGIDLGAYPSHDFEVRGRTEPVRVRVIADATELPL
jgi:adenylate cyclase